MKKTRMLSLIALFFFQFHFCLGQETGIRIPEGDDKYSEYVKKLEQGNTDIDFADFRNSFLDSKQFGKKGTEYNDLKKKVYEEITNRNYKKVIELTQSMLSLDYTSMFAHMYLQKTYGILGDTVNQRKYHDIEFGLLNSIIKSGDGKTCETGWHVTQIEEEYFILNVMGVTLQMQSISQGGNNNCDKMDVKTEKGELKTYYFEANKVFEMERKLFGM